jgi:hypothetical protein
MSSFHILLSDLDSELSNDGSHFEYFDTLNDDFVPAKIISIFDIPSISVEEMYGIPDDPSEMKDVTSNNIESYTKIKFKRKYKADYLPMRILSERLRIVENVRD